MAIPKISVVTAVYNGEKYIAHTVRSILSQSFKDFEYILVDDASTDESVNIIRQFNDPRIKLICNAENSRLVVTRNRGIEAARGEFIALIDHDDVALPNRLECQLNEMLSNSKLVLVGALAQNIDSTGKLMGRRARFSVPTPEHSKIQLLFRNHFVNSTVFFRRIEGFRYSADFPLAEDYDFIERMSCIGDIQVLNEVLVNYRIHNNNYSSKTQDLTRQGCRRIKSRQLTRLDIVQSSIEEGIFESFEYPPDRFDEPLLEALLSISCMIRKGNIFAERYDPVILDEIVLSELYMIAQSAAKYGRVNRDILFREEFLRALKSKPLGVMRANIRWIIERFSMFH